MTCIRLSTRSVSILSIGIASVCISMLLSACANMSGLGGSADYGCKAPQGVQCDSVSGNYYNAIQNNLPSQRQQHPAGAAGNGGPFSVRSAFAHVSPTPVATPIVGKASDALPLPIELAPSPLRSQARVLRLWFKPWEDADHDLYDQGYVYVQIDSGRWLIDHAQQRIRDAYAPVRAPRPKRLPVAVPATPTSSRLFGTGAPDISDIGASQSGSKPSPGAADMPFDDSQ